MTAEGRSTFDHPEPLASPPPQQVCCPCEHPTNQETLMYIGLGTLLLIIILIIIFA